MALAIFEFAHITGSGIKCILHGEASREDDGPRWLSLAIFEFAHITGRAIECILHDEASRKDGSPRWLSLAIFEFAHITTVWDHVVSLYSLSLICIVEIA